jgi:hypothetical protein
MGRLMEQTALRTWLRLRVRIDWSLLGVILAIKGLILVLGALSFQAYADQRIGSLRGWLEIWSRWDAPHYLDLAQYGYQPSGEIGLFLVFYPLFPWLTRAVGLLTGDMLVGAFIVSTLASLATGALLQRLVALDEPPALARQAVWFLLIFPTSYFLHIGYTESLFMALMLGCFLAARTERWTLAGALGALACLTRINGLILIPALLVEAWLHYRATRRWQWQWLSIGLVGLGFAGYLLLNYRVTGDPLRFLTIQHEHWYKSLAWPWVGIEGVLRAIVERTPSEAHMLGVQELIFITLGLVCTLICCARLRPSYSVWMAGNWLLFTSTSFIMSVPRYTLTLFPIFIIFAHAAEDRRWSAVITAWSLLFMGLFVSLFVQSRWAF